MQKRALCLCLVGMILCFSACKKKGLEDEAPSTIEVEDLPAPAADLPNKIDPAAEVDVVAAPTEDPLPDEAPPPAPIRTEDDYRAGVVGDVQLIRVFADRFERLDRKSRVLAYHLARAVLAGRDIIFDQIHPQGLQVRMLVECVLRSFRRTENDLEDDLSKYLFLLAVNSGFYDRRTGHKFVPGFDFEAFSTAVSAAHAAGAEVLIDRDEPLEVLLSKLRQPMFDPDYQPELVPRARGKNRDPLLSTPLNIYKGVRSQVLDKFAEQYPVNSRLVMVDGHLVEQVYRAGDRRRQIAPGRYARILRRVLNRLDDAVSTAGKSQRLILSDLSEYLRSGDPSAFDSVVRAWQAEEFEVEFLLGFLDRSTDPRKTKGLYGGLVGYLDRPGSSKLDSLLRQVDYFEGRMPWPKNARHRWKNAPTAAAIHLLTGAGRIAPGLRFSFELEPDPLQGPQRNMKMLLFSNVIDAYRYAVDRPLARTFLAEPAAPGEKEPLGEGGWTRIAIRELLGRKLGVEHRDLDSKLGRFAEPLRALKAELVSLWLLSDAKVLELGLVTGKEAVGPIWRTALVEMIALDALTGSDELDAIGAARRILIRYLTEQAKVMELAAEEGQTPKLVLRDEAFADALAALMNTCEHILKQADRQEAKALLQQYAAPPAWPHWQAFADKVKTMGLGKRVALIMPKLRPSRSTVTNRIDEVTLSHGEDLQSQLLRISRY